MSTPLTFTIQIAGVTYDIKEGTNSFDFNPIIEQRTKLTFTVLDPNNAFNFVKGQQITLTDSANTIQFTGTIHTSVKYKIGTGNERFHDIDCNDMHQYADERTSNRIYTQQYSGVIAAGMVNDNLAGEGITANFAIREDNSQTEFGQGTLSGTVATSNNGGDLELALAGSQVTIVESTTSNFSTGTLNNVTAANNSLTPTSTPAIKLQGTQSVPGNGNSYTYLIIWGGSIALTVDHYIAYDIWIDSSSPQAMIGVDILFSDGTSLRDNSIYNDVQDLPPHPNTDLAGVATDQWYHREFFLDNFIGKTISWIYVAIEGDNAGTYTGYIKNIIFENSDHSFNQYFFGSSLNLNPPFQAQTNGYSGISLTVVNTYDCSNAYRVSGSYSISSVGVLRNSFLSYDVSVPSNYVFTLSYSIDGGNSYFPCTDNVALPNLPSGMTLTGKSVQFLEQFSYAPNSKPNPEEAPVLTFVEAVLNPSYTTSKTDVIYSTATSWTGAGTTLTHTTGNGGVLNLTGVAYNWDDGNTQSANLYSASGFFADGCANKGFSITIGATPTADARAKLDFAGSYTDQIIDVDIAVEAAFTVGVVYRTSNWGNNNDSYAYAVSVSTTQILFAKGSNSTGAGAFTSLGTATISVVANNFHHLQVIVTGSTHKIYFDNILMLTVTDSTYAGPGQIGLRIYNASGATQQGRWDNFGVAAALTGTWTSPNTSIASATTYGTSVVMWSNASTANSTVTILVEASLNNGSTYATCTNGQPIPGLTVGQSLSGVSVKFRVTLTSLNAASFPGIQYFNVYVIGQFSSTGTRIAPVLSLSSALTAGSTVVNWNAVTPPNTSITVATSLDNITYTSVSNGGAINGITTQPSPMLDTFAVDDHTSYTSTSQTGGASGTWNFDTVNSRVTINSGTNAALLWTAISTKDVDVILDADQINQGGLVWRWQSASNFYALLVYDASSNAGNTNIIQLVKVVSNVTTQIGSNVAISFTRGTYHRFHVLMVGTSIKVYVDDFNTIINTTDSSLAGPGQVGMFHVSGTGSNGDSFRNLRIQPQGQSLSGVNAYTKVTLSSTDPTVTPQLTDLVLAALHPNIGLGALIPTANYKRTFISPNMDDLSKKSDYYWLINAAKALIFNSRTAIPAPWILTSNDILFPDDESPSTLSVENSADLYRNRMILINVLDTKSISETHPGDGKSTSWTLQYAIVGTNPSISVNGNPKTIGQKGIDTGKDFYYALGSTSLAQDASGAILEPEIDSFTITYTGQYTTEVVRDNTGGFPNTTSQSQYAALTGGSGIVEVVEDVSSQQLTVAAAQAYGDSLLQRYGVIGRTLVCQTNRTGLSVGQYLAVVIPELGINDAAMLITAMDLTMEVTLVGSQASMLYYWKITACEGPTLGSWQKTLVQILGYSPSSKGY
jgi:hypothetical protein